MDGSRSRLNASASLPTLKRNAGTAGLERDSPCASSSKRLQTTLTHSSIERNLARLTSERVKLEKELRDRDEQVKKLEADRRWLAEREETLEKEKAAEKEIWDAEKTQLTASVRTLRSQLATSREEQADVHDRSSSLSRTISSQKSQLARVDSENKSLKARISQLQAEVDRLSLQKQVDLPTNANTPARSEDQDIILSELHRQASYLRTLESTNTRMNSELSVLRTRNTNVEVMNEEKRGLLSKISMLEGMLQEAERKIEEQVYASTERERAPTLNVSELAALQLEHVRLLDSHGTTQAELSAARRQISHCEARITETEESARKSRESVLKVKENMMRSEQDRKLQRKRIEFLEGMIANLKDESIQNGTTGDISTSNLLEEYKSLRTDSEQTSLADSKATIISLQQTIASQQARVDTLNAKLSSFDNLTKIIEGHVATIDNLEQELFELRGEIAGGRHVPPNQRILKMSEEPDQGWVDLRKEVLDRLKGENEALLERLRELESRVGSAAPSSSSENQALVPAVSYDLLTREKEELEDIVKQKEKRLSRLQQVFASKSKEFREAITAILGVKLGFYPNGQVKVSSIYDLDASFVFQPTSTEMKMQLVGQGQGGPQDLPQMMQYWVNTEQCIPGFLASVTLECYDKSKQEARET